MIINLDKFIKEKQKSWEELESILDKFDKDHVYSMNLQEIKDFHYLHEQVSADLAKVSTFAAERETRAYLGSLVARSYGQIHETRRKRHRFRPFRWFLHTFPTTFRRHYRAFYLSAAVTLVGCILGGLIAGLDPSSKEIIMPFGHLMGDPSERVAEEEKVLEDRLKGMKTQGAAWYMQHNTKVSILTMSMGATWGVGTIILLFYNGVLLGCVAADYILAGETKFLVGWLLPHGSVEIPAILLAGQAGLILAGAMIGWGKRIPLKARLRAISRDMVTLIFGVAILLTWAGIIEAFLSQYHEPIIPYSFKIIFGCGELALLSWFLSCSGKQRKIIKEQVSD
ncbi:stage II sporulation protein M [Verrucomicrobiota bacterium]